ncbi:MAG: hypothetical protein GF411_07845 [Candidatus Lokiarchaeota archaeon]|nr:hypothetical protein [Candidatus Lokiarchaeota archaeon]
MSDSTSTSRRKIGFTTIVSSIFLIATLVWGTTTLIMIQTGQGRIQTPHEPYTEIEDWAYNIPWAGGRASWFDNINYTDLPLDQPLPEDLMNQLENVIFIAEPSDPLQLWRASAFDSYDGSGWKKSSIAEYSVSTTSLADATAQGNEIYTVYLNLTAGSSVGEVQLPIIFPDQQIITDSFTTYPSGRLLSYTLTTDDYGTVLLGPTVQGDPGENVLFSYQVTYSTQDLENIESTAIEDANAGLNAPPSIRNLYSVLDIPLSQRVQDNISQFDTLNAFENSSALDVALYVEQYFKSTFDLMMDPDEYSERPSDGQEVTDWFIERGGGLPMDFATAYSVYMRSLDIPARVTMGYAVGDQDGDQRIIRVRHMMFWAEVFIPTSDGGDWIQVIPFSLTPDMGGGQTPENVDETSIELYAFPADLDFPYGVIGEDAYIGAAMSAEGFFISQPETITFYDHTDEVVMGSTTIQPGELFPLANLTYVFPEGSFIGQHNISATWTGPDFSVSNWTYITVGGSASPVSLPSISAIDGFIRDTPDVIDPKTVQVNIANGFDNHTAYWDDTISVQGVLTVGGSPVNGSTLENDQVQIMWDNVFYANATIAEDGSYSLDIFVDPFDFVRMTVGGHEIKSYYAGEFTESNVIFPGESQPSTVTVQGIVSFTYSVTPTLTFRGDVIEFEGVAQLRNGTTLDGITVGIIFDGVLVNTTTSNSSGGFLGYYTIPGATPSGSYPASVNWTSPGSGIYANISGDTSTEVFIDVQTGATDLTIQTNPIAPGPIHIFESVTVFGNLTETETGNGIVGREITIYWESDSVINLGTVTTGTGGYYELTFGVPDGYLGNVTIWSVFDAVSDPSYLPTESFNRTMTVVKWLTQVQVSVDPNPVHLLEDLSIDVRVYLPENGSYLSNAPVTIWWQNSTTTHNLTIEITNSTGWIHYQYTIPIDHSFEIVNITAQFISPALAYSDNVSSSYFVQITNYLTTLTINSNSTVYHLNETAFIWGYLEHENGTGLSGQSITINWDWNNGTVDVIPVVTNSTGHFEYIYSFSLADGEGTIDINATYTSPTILYNGSVAYLMPSMIHQLYQLSLTGDFDQTPAEYHLDESFIFSGSLSFVENGNPISGATIVISYLNSSGVFTFDKVTNSSGGYSFQYNCTLNDALGAIYVWASYLSTDPLWENAQSVNRTADLILYQMSLTINTDTSSYFLDEIVTVTGQLTFQDNGTELADKPIRVWWNNGSAYAFEWYITNSTGHFTFLYNLSLDDATGMVDIWAEFENTIPLWDNATSSTVQILLELYQFDLTISTNSSSYFLDEVVYVTGQLVFSHNSTPVENGAIRILWNNGSVFQFQWYYTDSSGQFDFYYNLSTSDATGTVLIQVEFENINPLWNNASSNSVSIDLDYYSFTLGIATDAGFYFLDEVVHVYGQLTYTHNGTELVGAPIRISWNNGSTWFFQWYYTNSTGYYNFYYNLSPSEGEGNIDIRAYFENTNPLWNNATSLLHSISIGKYSTTMTVMLSPNPVYLNETLTIYIYLQFSHNSSGVSAQQVNLYWNNGTEFFIASIITDANGEYWYTYSKMDEDTIWTGITIHGEYAGNALIAGVNSTGQGLTLQQWPTIFTGVNTGGITIYHLTETIIISGTLYYDTNPDVVFGGATIDLLLDGWLANQTVTGSDGSFTAYWYINESVSYSTYTLTVRYLSGVNWIADASDSLFISITENALSWIFTVSPTPVNLGQSVSITGTLLLENGTGYAGASVNLYWRHESGPDIFITSVVTLGDGSFSYSHFIDLSTPLGDSDFWANCTPADSHIAAGQSPIRTILIQTIAVELTCSTDTGSDYRGSSVTISGLLTFSNGTPMSGYNIGIFWNGALLTNRTTDGSGSYSYSFIIGWTVPVGTISYYAVFTRPDASYAHAQSQTRNFDIRDLIQLTLYPQTITEITAGEELAVSGYVTNGNNSVEGVFIQIVFDSSLQSEGATTDSIGEFLISYTIPTSTAVGDHTISIGVVSSYYDLSSTPDSWIISVQADSEIEVEFVSLADTMVGETITFRFHVQRTSGELITNGSVTIELGNTVIGTYSIASSTWTEHAFTIPLSWSEGSGLFTLHAIYSGIADIAGSEAESDDSIHIFSRDVVFDTSQTLSVVIPGQPLVITVILTDDSTEPIPIKNRDVRIDLNGTDSVRLTTNDAGRVSYTAFEAAPEGQFNFTIVLLSTTIDVQSDTQIVQIGIVPIPGLDTALIIMWVVIIAIEVVVAMIIFARYGAAISRWTRRFRFRMWDGTKLSQYIKHG